MRIRNIKADFQTWRQNVHRQRYLGRKVTFCYLRYDSLFRSVYVLSWILRSVSSFWKMRFSLSETDLCLLKAVLWNNLSHLSFREVHFIFLPFIAAVCSFGGLCVIIQIAALGVDFSLVPFFISRLTSAFLSAVICRFIYPFFILDSVLTSVTNNVKFVKVNNFVPSFCLIMMILLLTLKKRLAFSKTVWYN